MANKFRTQNNHWEVGLASVGVEHHTFGATVLGGVGVRPMKYQTKASLGTHMASKFPKQIVMTGFGWRRLVSSNRYNGNFTNGGSSAGSGGWC